MGNFLAGAGMLNISIEPDFLSISGKNVKIYGEFILSHIDD
jgi:hypothetical protein